MIWLSLEEQLYLGHYALFDLETTVCFCESGGRDTAGLTTSLQKQSMGLPLSFVIKFNFVYSDVYSVPII